MKNRVTVYLDTSVINFLYADDAPVLKKITQEFFNDFIATGKYRAVISAFVIEEIQKTTDKKKEEKLLESVKTYNLEIVDLERENLIRALAKEYISHKIIPSKKLYDALHVAFCVVNKIPVLVSWNYKHLANYNRERRINAINSKLHSSEIRILTPIQLLDYEK